MTIRKPQTLRELIGMKGINISDIPVITKKAYYDIVSGKAKPREKTIEKLASFLEIEPETLKKLIKNGLK